MSTSSACLCVLPLPSPQGLAKHVVAVASRCRFNAHATPKSFRHALNSQIPLARCSLWRTVRFSPVDKDTTCCFLAQRPPLMITPADTDRRVTLVASTIRVLGGICFSRFLCLPLVCAVSVLHILCLWWLKLSSQWKSTHWVQGPVRNMFLFGPLIPQQW